MTQKKELYERFTENNIPDVRITPEEWRNHYANTYNILALNGSEQDKIFAAEDIIKIYLLTVAENS